ncbi:unnamed protein product [Prunus armeniaca]
MEWLLFGLNTISIGPWNWTIQFSPFDFTQTPPNDSAHRSYKLRSEMEWLVYCIVLTIGFYSKHSKCLLPPYYDVPQVFESMRYRLVHEIGQFKFVRSSL